MLIGSLSRGSWWTCRACMLALAVFSSSPLLSGQAQVPSTPTLSKIPLVTADANVFRRLWPGLSTQIRIPTSDRGAPSRGGSSARGLWTPVAFQKQRTPTTFFSLPGFTPTKSFSRNPLSALFPVPSPLLAPYIPLGLRAMNMVSSSGETVGRSFLLSAPLHQSYQRVPSFVEWPGKVGYPGLVPGLQIPGSGTTTGLRSVAPPTTGLGMPIGSLPLGNVPSTLR